MTTKLAALFDPASVAVIGASATPGKLGNTVVRYLLNAGYSGRVIPVNRSGDVVEGFPGAARLAGAGLTADVAMLVVPAPAIADALRDCGEAGVKFAIIGASGFAELGTAEGHARQAELAGIGAQYGMRLIGPNTNGIYDITTGLSLGYSAAHGLPKPGGGIAVVSHSGALFDAVAERIAEAGGGLGRFVAVGNEADLGMLDFLEHFIEEKSVSVIGLVMEAIGDGARLRDLASRATRAGKRIVALKVGRSEAGKAAALAHSSRMAGSARAYDALLSACGIARVSTVEALGAACALAERHARPATPKPLLCVTTSGAGGAILVDTAAEIGLPVVDGPDRGFPADTTPGIDRIKTPATVRHPIDIGSLGAWSVLDDVMQVLEANGMDGPSITYCHKAATPDMTEGLIASLTARIGRTGAPTVILAPGGLGAELESRYAAEGIPVFRDTACAMAALKAWIEPAAADEAAIVPADAGRAVAVGEMIAAIEGDVGDELASAAVLRHMGVPMVESVPVDSADAAVAVAERIGFPVVLKAIVPGVAHKNEAGLVKIGLADADALRHAYADLSRKAAGLDGGVVVLQKMHRARHELILGVVREEGLGHFLLFGLGGLQAELMGQSTMLAVPASRGQIAAALETSLAGRLIVAGSAHAEARTAEIIDALMSLQALALEQGGQIVSAEINPMLVTDEGCIAVDALLVLDSETASA